MKLKEQAIKRLEELKPQALARVYDLIIELKHTDQAKKRKKTNITLAYSMAKRDSPMTTRWS